MRPDLCPECDEYEGVLVSDDSPGTRGIYLCRDCLIFYSATVPAPTDGLPAEGWEAVIAKNRYEPTSLRIERPKLARNIFGPGAPIPRPRG